MNQPTCGVCGFEGYLPTQGRAYHDWTRHKMPQVWICDICARKIRGA